ncbi:hypothetical protein JX266_004858 [Neoarthrinium moseri]|nr:hypothetical protein JX266_004858 [Neoarthrinium moseri]
MALQSNVLENGEWVTRTLNPRELFRQTSSSHQTKTKQQAPTPPSYGILTKTVFDSPVFHWVLPVQLRSSRNNDVAFIGDNFVQIRELRPDVQLQDVARKQDFGSRIRNACVIGSPSNYVDDQRDAQIKVEDGDIEMDNAETPNIRQLPPQLLALVLEGGDLVFLYIKETAHGLDFVSFSRDIPTERLVCPGFHMAVDPSSRYLVLACAEVHFQIFELESMETLRARCNEDMPLDPVRSVHSRAVRGVIHKIEFLSPGPDNEEVITLMLILVHKRKSRIATYDWELGDDIESVFQMEKSGWRVREDCQMPLLVIPSTVRFSFLAINEDGQAFWATLASGEPNIELVDIGYHDESDLHMGSQGPLWTAWSRPSRLPEYHFNHDTIYLAREDGILNYLEITAGDGVQTNVIMSEVKCNIDKAFACLYDQFGDVLITGGDSGPGALWRALPRQIPRKIATIPNWSPTVDITSKRNDTRVSRSTSADLQLSPDRIFACSGRGKAGSVAEYRFGLEATIGPEIDFEDPVKQCWAMRGADDNFDLLVSFPNRSAVLHVKADFTEAVFQDQAQVPYDLASCTLAVEEFEGTTVQVTSSCITIITTSDSTRHFPHEFDDGCAVIMDATIRDGTVALVLHGSSGFRVKTFSVDGINIIEMGIWESAHPVLAIYPTKAAPPDEQPQPALLEISRICPNSDVEALTSIVVFDEKPCTTSLCFGTRSGEVLTLSIDPSKPLDFEGTYDKFGHSAASVSPLSMGTDGASVLVCCHSWVTVMRKGPLSKSVGFETRTRVWVTNTESSVAPSPALNSVSQLRLKSSEVGENPSLAMLSGSMLYITELQNIPKPVLRHLPVAGTPVKVMYSQILNVLVVAILEEERPSLNFIDPETGLDVSRPTDGSDRMLEYINGLGKEGGRIYSLTEWKYAKGGRTWAYIIVSVGEPKRQGGSILLVSAERHDSRVSEDGPYRIRFFTKFKRVGYTHPVYSVASDEQGLLLCSGQTVYYEILDTEQKKLRKVKEHQLPSPASHMEVVNGNLHVVTLSHSLEILDFKSTPEDDTMIRLHSDDRAKSTVHSIQAVGGSGRSNNQPVTLLSDAVCGLWGIWAPLQTDRPLKTIFHAELQASVRKFIKVRTRPPWDFFSRHIKYGHTKSGDDNSDILGLGVDGSLQHFTILSTNAWRLLRFIQNLALRSPEICPSTAHHCGRHEDEMDVGWDPEPQTLPALNMQVDGDILQRCLDKQALENLLSDANHRSRFMELLQAFDEGRRGTASPEALPEAAFDVAYDMLRYYLAPAL